MPGTAAAAAGGVARAPPEPDEPEPESAPKYAQPEPEPEVISDTLRTLRGVTQQRALPPGKTAAKLLHKDSSERLLPDEP